jgi:two-component system, sensor histidine kinase YesM
MNSGSSSVKTRMVLTTLPLVIIPLFLVLVLISVLAGTYLKSFILEKLDSSNERINEKFDLLTEQMEDIMRQMIVNIDVQRSLTQPVPSHGTTNAIRGYLKQYYYGPIRFILFVDNHNTLIQTHELSAVTMHRVARSHIQTEIAGTYGRQIWTFNEDDLSGESGRFLFISRYLRHLDLNVDPGILVFKIDPEVLQDVFDPRLMVTGADYLLLDQHDRLVYHSGRPELVGSLLSEIAEYSDRTRAQSESRTLLSRHSNIQTGWQILSVIPYRIAVGQLRRLQWIMYIIMLLAAAGTVAVVNVAALKFTGPIRELEGAMHTFRDGDFSIRVPVMRADEIGEMAKSFNRMADEIGELLDTIQKDQEALTSAELESLSYQINPHFVYNTLDNVHMLARTSGDERISKLILSLTKFLRISLSKGHNIIRLDDEFEHVENYLNIQKIRFGDSFDFAVSLDPAIADAQIVKFILQPIAENCISHGFRELEAGGSIEIKGTSTDEGVEIVVEDNGVGIDPEVSDRLNNLPNLPTDEVLEAFPKREGGYGIGNVVARLNIYYGDNYRLHFGPREGGGTVCRLLVML